MDRRSFLLKGAFACVALASRHAFSAQDDSQKPFVLTVHPDRPIATIAPDFLGLGYEISSVSKQGLLSRDNRTYVQLVRTLGEQGVIRIGGNTSDYARYSPRGSSVSSAFGTVINDAALADLGGFLRATGWKLIWGFDLGKGSESDAVAEAKAVLAAAGERLLAFEIGNEPDLFGPAKHRKSNYSYLDWLAEYRRYKEVLRAQFPRIPFAGPDAAGKTDWVTRFAADEGKDIVLLTHHYYREGQNPTSTIEKLLANDPKLQPKLAELSAATRSCKVPYRICEVNSFSGGGRPGVSDTMGAALWVLDYMFKLAANGCSGVNMETGLNHLDFVSSYSPIGDDEHRLYSAKPEYYGMLAFSIGGKGTMLQTQLEPFSSDVATYAARQGKDALAITLINKGAGCQAVEVNMAGPMQSRHASVLRLRAPAVDAKAGITLGAAEVTSQGTWKSSKLEAARVSSGKLSLKLPPDSAAILQVV